MSARLIIRNQGLVEADLDLAEYGLVPKSKSPSAIITYVCEMDCFIIYQPGKPYPENTSIHFDLGPEIKIAIANLRKQLGLKQP